MGLKRLTVTSKNGDTTITGVTLFNSDYMEGVRTTSGASTTSFMLRRYKKDANPDKYVVSDVLGTVTDTYDENNGEVYRILVQRENIHDSTSTTTNRVFDLRDIVKGIALPSDITQSILWVERTDNKVEKVLVDNFLKAIEDYWQTGTTTTYE